MVTSKVTDAHRHSFDFSAGGRADIDMQLGFSKVSRSLRLAFVLKCLVTARSLGFPKAAVLCA